MEHLENFGEFLVDPMSSPEGTGFWGDASSNFEDSYFPVSMNCSLDAPYSPLDMDVPNLSGKTTSTPNTEYFGESEDGCGNTGQEKSWYDAENMISMCPPAPTDQLEGDFDWMQSTRGDVYETVEIAATPPMLSDATPPMVSQQIEIVAASETASDRKDMAIKQALARRSSEADQQRILEEIKAEVAVVEAMTKRSYLTPAPSTPRASPTSPYMVASLDGLWSGGPAGGRSAFSPPVPQSYSSSFVEMQPVVGSPAATSSASESDGDYVPSACAFQTVVASEPSPLISGGSLASFGAPTTVMASGKTAGEIVSTVPAGKSTTVSNVISVPVNGAFAFPPGTIIKVLTIPANTTNGALLENAAVKQAIQKFSTGFVVNDREPDGTSVGSSSRMVASPYFLRGEGFASRRGSCNTPSSTGFGFKDSGQDLGPVGQHFSTTNGAAFGASFGAVTGSAETGCDLIATSDIAPTTAAKSTAVGKMAKLEGYPKCSSKKSGGGKMQGGARAKRTTEPKEERKKRQNREAASRYRMKKKAESVDMYDGAQELEDRNLELKAQAADLEREVGYLKSLMTEIKRLKDGT